LPEVDHVVVSKKADSGRIGRTTKLWLKVFLVSLVTISVGGQFLDQSVSTKPVADGRNSSPRTAVAKAAAPTFPAPSKTPVMIQGKPISPVNSSPIPDNPVITLPEAGIAQLAYNMPLQDVPQSRDRKLDGVIDEVVAFAQQQGLPTESLSISLVDLSHNRKAAYQEKVMRFPASVVKLFWMVELYSGIERGTVSPDYGQHDLQSGCKLPICRMIQDSDNESASKVVDVLTNTISSKSDIQSAAEYQTWAQRREGLDIYFQRSGYEGISLKHKNFPIPYLGLDRPQGADLQLRGSDPSQPIRNRISTAQATKLMQDIVTGRAVSPRASATMMQLLTRYDLQTGEWKAKEYDPIEGFFGESLPTDTYLASKVGWTSDSRQEVAYIKSSDGRAEYILTIFADDPKYAKDWKVFPKISKLVFDRMQNANS
jgi:Beta-lactamase enzyme family